MKKSTLSWFLPLVLCLSVIGSKPSYATPFGWNVLFETFEFEAVEGAPTLGLVDYGLNALGTAYSANLAIFAYSTSLGPTTADEKGRLTWSIILEVMGEPDTFAKISVDSHLGGELNTTATLVSGATSVVEWDLSVSVASFGGAEIPVWQGDRQAQVINAGFPWALKYDLDLDLSSPGLFLNLPVGDLIKIDGAFEASVSTIGFTATAVSKPYFEFTFSIPEPATLLLLGTGLFGLVGLRRKFKA